MLSLLRPCLPVCCPEELMAQRQERDCWLALRSTATIVVLPQVAPSAPLFLDPAGSTSLTMLTPAFSPLSTQ